MVPTLIIHADVWTRVIKVGGGMSGRTKNQINKKQKKIIHLSPMNIFYNN